MRRGDTWLVHNGEIYNYLELASELRDAGCVLVTETDTEVILAAYQAWGMDAIRRFNGMWALRCGMPPGSGLCSQETGSE